MSVAESPEPAKQAIPPWQFSPGRLVHEVFGVRYSRSATAWSATMETGPWMFDADGHFHPGSMSVLADIGLAMPLFFGRRDLRHGPVTVTLALEFPPADIPTGTLAFAGEARGEESQGTGVTTGIVFDEAGRVLVSGSMIGKLTRLPDSWDGFKPETVDHHDLDTDLARIFGAKPVGSAGSAVLDLTIPTELSNPRGAMHGGAMAALVDIVSTAALPGGAETWRLVALRVDFHRPAKVQTSIHAHADLIRVSSSFGFTSVQVTDAVGKLLATATTTHRRLHR